MISVHHKYTRTWGRGRYWGSPELHPDHSHDHLLLPRAVLWPRGPGGGGDPLSAGAQGDQVARIHPGPSTQSGHLRLQILLYLLHQNENTIEIETR